jgi:acyl-coenzyme A thioesterase PaaI-like protein
MSELYQLYQQLGNEGYGKAVGKVAPYFSTIDPQFKNLKPGYCEIAVVNQESVHNHLGTVHAIAMCNAAELVAGLMTDVSIPGQSRWIPVGMTVRYLAMAKQDLKVFTTNGDEIDWQQHADVVVNVDVYSGEDKAMEAEITMRLSAKK